MVLVALDVPIEPSLSVTVRVTLKVPEVPYEWLAVAPVALEPSPKFQE